MKKYLMYLAVTCSALLSPAQEDEAIEGFKQGNSVVTAGYGAPNLVTLFLRLTYMTSGRSNYRFYALGPLLARYEYGLTNEIGVGICAGYTTAGAAYDFEDWDISKTKQLRYRAVISWHSTSIGLRANGHFGTTEALDPYIGLGAGYTSHRLAYTDNSPWTYSYNVPFLTGFYFNFGVGLRFYITPDIGIYAEAGWDKAALLQAGAAVKF